MKKPVVGPYQTTPIRPINGITSNEKKNDFGEFHQASSGQMKPLQPPVHVALSNNPTLDFFSRLDQSLSHQNPPVVPTKGTNSKLTKQELAEFDLL
jgi:hypothetical protein